MNGKQYFEKIFEQDFKEVNMISPDLPDFRFRQLAEEWGRLRGNIPFLPNLKQYKLIIKNLPSSNAHIVYGEEILVTPTGFSAFIHEIGHSLDYYMKLDGKMASEQMGFKRIKDEMKQDTSAYLKRKKLTLSQRNRGFVFSTHELFARAFEYYMWNRGFHTSFNKSEQEKRRKSIDEGYRVSKKTQVLISQYFDELFSENQRKDDR